MKKITDRDFKYTPSFNTDLRKKFRRMAQEQRAQEAEAAKAKAAADEQAARDVVVTIKRGVK